MIVFVLSFLGFLRMNDPPLDGVAVGTRTWRVPSWHGQSSPTLAARLQTVNILSCEGTGASRRKLIKAKINLFSVDTELQRNVAEVYLSSLCWQRVHYTPISMKSRLTMINYMDQLLSFFPRILVGVSSSVRSAGHLSGLHLSVSPSGMPTCPASRRTPCGHRVSSVPRARRTLGCVGGVPVSGPVGRGGLASPIWIFVSYSFSGFLT